MAHEHEHTGLRQLSDDTKAAGKHVDALEKRLEKKTSKGLRDMLEGAYMAGIKHGRDVKAQPTLDDMLGLLNRGAL